MTHKLTVAVGYKSAKPEDWESLTIEQRYVNTWKPCAFHRRGFWKSHTIAAIARRSGYVGKLEISYTMIDSSGKGRTYTERKETIDL